MQDDRPFVLVTGGAGYIGSHVVHALRDAEWPVVVVDDLSTGRRAAVPEAVPLIEGDIGDRALMDAALARHTPIAVMHFAGSIVVPESVTDPLRYYSNNTAASLTLISACVAAGVDNFIFSSTAAVYGEPRRSPVAEDDPTAPINPYGSSKLCTEWILRDTSAATPLRYVALRYFNVAGADPDGRTGQSTEKATHLIKVACQAALGLRPDMQVFGDDYPTADGTCVRDYIHVSDLAAAHVKALEYLIAGGGSTVLNCGYGHGFSVRQVLETVRDAAEGELSWRIAPRRAGDPPELVSASGRIREVLGWEPRYDDLGFIVETAMDWERRLRDED
jgi:UDP-glucose 4-epimerase